MNQKLFACNECDYLIELDSLEEGQMACCPRCHHHIVEKKLNSINRTLAICFAGIIIFFPAILQPILSMNILGMDSSASLYTGMKGIWNNDLHFVAGCIFFFCIFTPITKLVTALIICLGVKAKQVHHAWFKQLFLYYYKADTWEMLEVFMMGILVSIFKLKDMADLSINFGVVCFATLVLCVNALKVTLDKRMIWDEIDNAK